VPRAADSNAVGWKVALVMLGLVGGALAQGLSAITTDDVRAIVAEEAPDKGETETDIRAIKKGIDRIEGQLSAIRAAQKK